MQKNNLDITENYGILVVILFIVDIDECEDEPCHMNAFCTNSEGSFSCQCNVGYQGNGSVCIGMLYHLVQ